MEEIEDPEVFRGAIPTVKDLAEAMRCFDPALVANWEPELAKWATKREAAIAAETKCRATPACLGERIATKICEALGAKREAEAQLAEKRRDGQAHGVASPTELHDIAVRIREADAALARHWTRYVQATKRPFDGACR